MTSKTMPAAAQSAPETGHIAVVSSLAVVQQQKRLLELDDAAQVDGVVPDQRQVVPETYGA